MALFWPRLCRSIQDAGFVVFGLLSPADGGVHGTAKYEARSRDWNESRDWNGRRKILMQEPRTTYERHAMTEGKLVHGDLTREIIGAAIEVHRELGPGLLESAYEECLCHELNARGLKFQRQLALPVTYKGTALDCGYRIDLLVENSVIIELKSIECILPIHGAQLLTYMRLMNKTVGILINFNVPLLKQGILRKVL